MAKHVPIDLFTPPESDSPRRTVVLFRIDGKPYHVDAAPGVNLALQVIDEMEEYGPGVAEIRMLKQAVGVEAFEALKAYKGLKPDHLQQIARAVTQLTLGALEDDDEPDEPVEEDGRGNSGGSASAGPSPAE